MTFPDKMRLELRKSFAEALQYLRSNTKCRYPGCTQKAINSHILQKNGILSKLEEEGHIIQPEVELYGSRSSKFTRKGMNTAFSFPCFCRNHDNTLFKPIEKTALDLTPYKNRLLFLIRAKLNEQFRKEVALESTLKILSNPKLLEFGGLIQEQMEVKVQKQLAIKDLQADVDQIWKDYLINSETFNIVYKKYNFLPICLSAFIDYETTEEMILYFNTNGVHIERLTSLNISVFPSEDSTVLLIAVRKDAANEVLQYVDSILKKNQKDFEIILSNWLLFYIETWVTSISFYKSHLEENEALFNLADSISYHLLSDEREVHHLNIFESSFSDEFRRWSKPYLELMKYI